MDESPSSYTEIASTAESTGAVPDLLELQPADSPSQLPPPETIEDQLLSVSPNQSAPTWDCSALDVAAAEPLSAEEKARLEKWILSALARNPRQSEVVMMVCERTGMNWNQAQRLAAEVSTKSRKKLNARENLILIPLAILFILAGLGLVYATFASRRAATGVLHLLAPTECVMDRLVAYYHWSDLQCLDQAVAVAKRHPVDLARIAAWSEREGAQRKFEVFRDRLERACRVE